MLILGIIGGVASGKSLVSTELARLGAVVMKADEMGHEVLREESVIAAARERWGSGVVSDDGQLSRKAIAAQVFGTGTKAAAERQFLDELTHPRIATRIREKISELATRGDVDIVVLDAALLLEAGWREYCDQIWFVDAPLEARVARAAARGWSAEQLAAREAAQLPLAEKRRQSDFTIDNSGSPEQTVKQIQAAWPRLMAAA